MVDFDGGGTSKQASNLQSPTVAVSVGLLAYGYHCCPATRLLRAHNNNNNYYPT